MPILAPLPTAAPHLSIVARKILERQASQTICGYAEGLSASPVTCATGQTCQTASDLGVQYCCGSGSDCKPTTTCVNSQFVSQNCNGNCNDDGSLQCTNDDSPYCYTMFWNYSSITLSSFGCTSAFSQTSVPVQLSPGSEAPSNPQTNTSQASSSGTSSSTPTVATYTVTVSQSPSSVEPVGPPTASALPPTNSQNTPTMPTASTHDNNNTHPDLNKLQSIAGAALAFTLLELIAIIFLFFFVWWILRRRPTTKEADREYRVEHVHYTHHKFDDECHHETTRPPPPSSSHTAVGSEPGRVPSSPSATSIIDITSNGLLRRECGSEHTQESIRSSISSKDEESSRPSQTAPSAQ